MGTERDVDAGGVLEACRDAASAEVMAPLLLSAFEQSSAGIFIMSAKGHTLLYNPRMEELTGYGRDEACEHGWFARLVPGGDSAAGGWLERSLADSRPARLEARVRRKDGSYTWLAFALQPLAFDGHALTLGMAEDVSQRKRLEQERGEALEEARRGNADLEVLADISALAVSTLDMGRLLSIVLARLTEATGAERALLLVPKDGRLVAVASVGLEEQVRAGFSLRDNEGFSGAVAAAKKSLYSPDVPNDSRILHPFLREHGVRSAYGVPLQRPDGGLEGVILIGWLAPHDHDEREQRLLEIVASRLASAMQNANLYEQSLRGRRLGEALNRVAGAVSSLDSDEVMRRVVGEARKALDADGAGISLVEGDSLVIRYADGDVAKLMGHVMSASATRLMAGGERGRTFVLSDLYSDERLDVSVTRRAGIGFLAGTPLVVRGRFTGGLALTWREPRVDLDEMALDFVSRIGSTASLALENARLYEAQAGIARTLQEALLASPDGVESVDIGYLYRSATEQAEVGGDFYDLFPIENDLAGVVVGDVSGKGVEAATLTALVKSVVRAYAYEDATPSSVMSKANEAIRRSSPQNIFVTMFYGTLTPSTGELVYCSGGHPPPLVRRSHRTGGGVEQLLGRCPLLGAFSALTFEDFECRLERGDVLVMYTDGLVEARDAEGGFYGIERVAEFLDSHPGLDARGLPEAMFEDVQAFSGGRLADDLAIVTMSVP